jgi:hypothetical protein
MKGLGYRPIRHHKARIHLGTDPDSAPEEPKIVPRPQPLPQKVYTYMKAEEEVKGPLPLSYETQEVCRRHMANALFEVGKTVQTFVAQYISDETLPFTVQLDAKVHTATGWNWVDPNDVKFEKFDYQRDPKLDTAFASMLPALKYRVGVIHIDNAPVFHINVDFVMKIIENNVVVRQIVVSILHVNDEISLTLFGRGQVQSFAELTPQTVPTLSTETLLRMCDIAMIKYKFTDAIIRGDSVAIPFAVTRSYRWSYGDTDESRTISGYLRGNISENFLDVREKIGTKETDNTKIFRTANDFIKWASNSHISGYSGIKLTNDRPTLLTLARVLDVLDGKITFIPQN